MSLNRDELEDLTLVLRSIVTSIKPPVSVRSIEQDYHKVESEHIPYRKLGFRSTLELLEHTNAFNFQRIGNDIFVTARPNPKSAHIASMVRLQKPSKTKAKIPRARSAVVPVRNYQTRASPCFKQSQSVQQFSRPQQVQSQSRSQSQSQFQSQSQSQSRLQSQSQFQSQSRLQLQLQSKSQSQSQSQSRLQSQSQFQSQSQSRLQLQSKSQSQLQSQLQSQSQRAYSQKVELERRLPQQQEKQVNNEIVAKRGQEQLGAEGKGKERLVQLQQQQEEVDKQLKELQVQRERLKQQCQLISQKEQQNLLSQWKAGVAEAVQEERKRQQKEALPATAVEMNENTTAEGSIGAARKPQLRPILGNSASQRLASAVMKKPASKEALPVDVGADAAANKRRPPVLPRVQYPGSRPTGGLSVNYRLKVHQMPAPAAESAASSASSTHFITPPATPEKTAAVGAPPLVGSQKQLRDQLRKSMVDGYFRFDPAYDAITSLEHYCLAMDHASPEYEFYNAFKSNKLHCKVRVGDTFYTSYPEKHPDEMTAKLRTAELAIEQLKLLESRKRLSVLSENEFLESLYKDLINLPYGILTRKLPEWYAETLQRQVPPNWWTLINSSPKFRVDSGVNSHIVFANTEAGSPALPPSLGPTTIPELQLPWADGQLDWSMYITHCDNTAHVWARLIDQTSHFEKLTEELNTYMSSPENRQHLEQHPQEQAIYVVEIADNWSRVRVMSVDVEQRQCSCHFVDFGDEMTFQFDMLYMCPPKALNLPGQAVCLSMYALDKFEDHPHALPVLAKELAGHSVVTRIITSEAQFIKAGGLAQGVLVQPEEPTEENGCARQVVRRACIVGTFYDTSTAEDIHVNDLVANQIIRNTPAPMLKLEQKSNPVLVSHVNDVGDLMVQIPNADLKFVQRSIAKIMNDVSKQHRVRYTDLLHDQLVCVCDEAGDGQKQWYRGMLTSKPKSPEEEVFDVYYVDDGRLRKTHISNIYRLEANNLALASYPPQALRVRLHDVPPIDDQMVRRLRSLLSPQTPVLLKVMEGTNDKLPMVTIHARGQDSLYLCLNSAIRVEYEVQSTSRLEPFDDGGLHFSPSGQLIRRSSFSSTVSSQSSCSDQPSAAGIASPPTTPIKFKSPLLLALKEYEAIPALGAYFEVRVSLSVNPGHFAVQPYKCYNQLQRMMKDLQGHCKSSSAQKMGLAQLSIGQPCAAADGDGVYHRVNIRKIYDEMIHVRYVDVGDDGVVRCDQLIHLTPEFRELPMMALPAQLHGIQLAGIVWTQENCLRFRELTLGQKFIGIVRGVDRLKDGRRALSLELIDTSTPRDIKVHETLINEKHAASAL